MPRLNTKQKAEVVKDYASGNNKSEIARKFNVSVTAVSKILDKAESLSDGEEFKPKSTEEQAKVRRDIISLATDRLFDKVIDGQVGAETLLKIIERLSFLEEKGGASDNELDVHITMSFPSESDAERVERIKSALTHNET